MTGTLIARSVGGMPMIIISTIKQGCSFFADGNTDSQTTNSPLTPLLEEKDCATVRQLDSPWAKVEKNRCCGCASEEEQLLGFGLLFFLLFSSSFFGHAAPI